MKKKKIGGKIIIVEFLKSEEKIRRRRNVSFTNIIMDYMGRTGRVVHVSRGSNMMMRIPLLVLLPALVDSSNNKVRDNNMVDNNSNVRVQAHNNIDNGDVLGDDSDYNAGFFADQPLLSSVFLAEL